MRTIVWLNFETLLENEAEHLMKKLKRAKGKHDKKEIKRLEKQIHEVNQKLSDLE